LRLGSIEKLNGLDFPVGLMAFVEWSDEKYAIGVEQVDDQHRQLFGLLNDLHDAMQEGKGRDVVGETLAELEEYTYYHFDSEEEFMNDCGFSHDCDGCFMAHQDAHRTFEEEVSELRELAENGNATVAMKTMRFLRSWLSEHVGDVDQQLETYLDEGDADLEPKEMSVSR
jgi:hemerythrin-like metal-binding protein